MIYYLMHKDRVVSILEFDSNCDLKDCKIVAKNEKYLPLPAQKDVAYLASWIQDRAIPKTRQGIYKVLESYGLANTNSLLLQNLGLSLTDCYWLCPENLKLSWKDVSMFSNEFSDTLYCAPLSDKQTKFSPNSSLQGELRKKWVIDEYGRRMLLKGNFGMIWQQSLNERFVTLLLKKQPNSFPFVEYTLQYTDFDGEKAIICLSEDFIKDDTTELIPLWDVYKSAKWDGHTSAYQTCVNRLVQGGLDEEYVRDFLSYEISLDYVITNTDRHFNNIGVIRDTETLEFLSFAPIYDCGNSLFWNVRDVPKTKEALGKIKTHSFLENESAMLKYLTSSVFDTSCMIGFEKFRDLYSRDSYETEERIKALYRTIELKCEMLESKVHTGKTIHSMTLF